MTVINEELFRAGLAMGLAMGGQGQGILKRIEAFIREVEELGVEVKVSVSIDILDKKVGTGSK